MDMPIIKGLMKYINDESIRFHMPGHKGKDTFMEWVKNIPQMDVTEIEGTDNLHNPKSIILKSQSMASKAFGSIRTYYSVNGTTGGIYASIFSVTKPGDKILIQRNCHSSVYNAIILGNLNVEYIIPKYDNTLNIVTSITPNDIEEKIKNDRDIKVVVITYPSYYGICCDIEEIAKIVHKYDRILIVDEAHGSHLCFNDNLPKSALEGGADISIQSTHKTLPAFTQSSMVHVGSDRVDLDRLRKALRLYQSTSPSYLLMSSIDFARWYMETDGKRKLDELVEYINDGVKYLNTLNGVRILSNEIINGKDIFDFDVTKIMIRIDGLTGKELEKILREEYNIVLELGNEYYGLALTSVFDDTEDIKNLFEAIKDISKKYGTTNSIDSRDFNNYIIPKREVSLSKAYHEKKEKIKLKESLGRISGSFIIPYPPGIPLLCPGEIISSEIIEYINYLTENNIEVIGLEDNKTLDVIAKDKRV